MHKSNAMIKRYEIKGITGSWLHQPGMMVYVEKEYDEPVNEVIKQYYDALSQWCTKNGLIFLYIPKFYRLYHWRWFNFMTGKKTWKLPYETTSIVLKHSLSESTLQQIEGPSLAFTSNENDELLAYQIEGDEKRTIEESLLNILSAYLQKSDTPADACMDEWTEPLFTLIRSQRFDFRINEGMLFTSEGASQLEEEELRLQEKTAILAKQKVDKEALEVERNQRSECVNLIQEAISLKNEEKYSEALKKLKKASAMDIPEKEDVIKAIKDEIEEQKDKNVISTRFGNWLNTILDEDSTKEHTGETKEHYAPPVDDNIPSINPLMAENS